MTEAETAINNARGMLTLSLPVNAPINNNIGALAMGIPACSRMIVTASTVRGWLIKKRSTKIIDLSYSIAASVVRTG
jgi:hypothetical protein